MSNEEPTTGFRRVSAKDRKERLERVEMLFPEQRLPVVTEQPVVQPVQEGERYPPVAPRLPKRRGHRVRRKSARRGFTRHDGIALLFILGTLGFAVYFVTLWRDPYSAINPLAPPTPTPIYVTATPYSLPANLRFQVVDEGVLYGVHPNGAGCEHRAIAGSIADGVGLQIKLTGQTVETTVSSGSTPLYGANGFEIPLPLEETEYMVQLFDAENTLRSDPVSVIVSENCDLNLAVVNFIPSEE